jgi:hypothetical protein
VLLFLPQPAETVKKMAAALKPGGWLLLEESDYVSPIPDPSMTQAATALSIKGQHAMLSLSQSHGIHRELGRHLYHDVSITGLVDIQAEGFVAMQLGDDWQALFPSARPRRARLHRENCLRWTARSW